METAKGGHIIIVGDLFPVPSNFSKFADGDVSYLFGDRIRELFASADYRICNLEGALTDKPGKCEKTGPVLFANRATVRAYKELGIDCCTLANNHITDAGAVGVMDTMQTLDNVGIKHLGCGVNEDSIRHYLFIDVKDKKICLYNVAETMYNAPTKTQPGAFLYDEYVVCRELETIKRDCDYLIVIYHGGAETFRYPTPQTRRRFHRMADCGADMILSQHTHCVGSEEWYGGAYLLYGQGNFLFRSFNNDFTDTGLIIELILNNNGFVVKKHIVDAVNDFVRYDEQQDFSAFERRSTELKDEDFVMKEFQKYCRKEVVAYIKAYKGNLFLKKYFNYFFPRVYSRYLLKSYTKKDLLFTLHSLRSEQNREVAIE